MQAGFRTAIGAGDHSCRDGHGEPGCTSVTSCLLHCCIASYCIITKRVLSRCWVMEPKQELTEARLGEARGVSHIIFSCTQPSRRSVPSNLIPQLFSCPFHDAAFLRCPLSQLKTQRFHIKNHHGLRAPAPGSRHHGGQQQSSSHKPREQPTLLLRSSCGDAQHDILLRPRSP